MNLAQQVENIARDLHETMKANDIPTEIKFYMIGLACQKLVQVAEQVGQR